MGDLNCHLDKPNDPDAKRLLDLLEQNCLEQCVTSPTHKAGHILDVVIHRINNNIRVDTPKVKHPHLVTNSGKHVDDHFAVHANLNLARPPNHKKTARYRDVKAIDFDALNSEIPNCAFNV